MRKVFSCYTSAAAIIAALAPAAAIAQSTPGGDTQTDPAFQQQSGTQVGGVANDQTNINADGSPVTPEEAADGDVVVTGSRIRLPNIQNLEPTIGINQRYLQDRGLTNVADALNEIPGIRGSITPAGAQGSFGQGVNFVNVFGLGSNRTLTLVNGRRYVSSNVNTIFNSGQQGTQVDVNVIPTLLVSNIDVVSIGGAPVYGSDAIAGTINYILDTRLKGVRAQVTGGVTEEGDGFRYNAAIAGGSTSPAVAATSRWPTRVTSSGASSAMIALSYATISVARATPPRLRRQHLVVRPVSGSLTTAASIPASVSTILRPMVFRVRCKSLTVPSRCLRAAA